MNEQFIPNLYGMDKRQYHKELHHLFNLANELQMELINNNQDPWF